MSSEIYCSLERRNWRGDCPVRRRNIRENCSELPKPHSSAIAPTLSWLLASIALARDIRSFINSSENECIGLIGIDIRIYRHSEPVIIDSHHKYVDQVVVVFILFSVIC